ncbi:MAG: hypothetical protein J6J79_09790 [Lachnospiraceae bacterium]|nr:hypothetical protein [Lachnospiraceae bacterium]
MIYDCFTFFNEVDLCLLRMSILDDIVDKFVVVEGTKTHSNNDKPLYFSENMYKFEKFKDKIIHIVVDEWPEYDSRWTFEHYQRNCILKGLTGCNEDDIIILSDLDEIPNPRAVKKAVNFLKKHNGICCFEMFLFFYFLNYLDYSKVFWYYHPKVFKYREFFQKHDSSSSDVGQNGFDVVTTPDQIRLFAGRYFTFHKGGWHFSTVGSKEHITQILTAIVDSDRIETCDGQITDIDKKILAGEHFISSKKSKLCSVKTRMFLPNYVLEHIDEYKDYMTDLRPSEEVKGFSFIVAKKFITKYVKSSIDNILFLIKNGKIYQSMYKS